MTRAELERDLDAVTRHLVLLAALVENLAYSLRTPQDGPELEDDRPGALGRATATTGMGSAGAARRTANPGDLPATFERRPDMDAAEARQ